MSFSLDVTEEVEATESKDNAHVLAMKETMLIVNNFLDTAKYVLDIEDIDKFIDTIKRIKDFDEFLDQRVPVQP
jgi:hypothetical protein